MRETKTRNAPPVKELEKYAAEHSVDLRPVLRADLAATGAVAARFKRQPKLKHFTLLGINVENEYQPDLAFPARPPWLVRGTMHVPVPRSTVDATP
jgi:hypothetical protein